MDHYQLRSIEKTGYPIPVRNPLMFEVDPTTCECGCRAVMSIKGNNRCASCADDEFGVVLL